MARFHSTLTWLILILEVLSNNAQSSLQECSGFNFLARPAPHYYTTPDSLLVIPCHAEQLLENDARRTISTTIFVDAFPVTVSGITVNTSSEQYEPHVDSEGRVIGLLIILDEDLVPPSLVRCSVVREGQELCHTGNSTITIGDGRPLPPPVEPYHMMDGFRSVQLQWEAFRTPTFAEITAYVVTYWLRNQTRVQAVAEESPGNVTTLEVMPLAPGSVYEVIVQGKNSFGLGEESRVGEIMTTIGDVSPVPAQVTASVQRLGTITVSWESVSVDLATMTVVSGYVLVLRREGNPQDEEVLVVTVDDPMATSHVLTMLERGRYTVGVASRNMAGQSTVRYTPDVIDVRRAAPNLPIIIAGVVVASCVVLVMLIVIFILAMRSMRARMRRMENRTTNFDNSSPPTKKKADPEDAKTANASSSIPRMSPVASSWEEVEEKPAEQAPHSLNRFNQPQQQEGGEDTIEMGTIKC